jgi:hypothetical protein
VAHHLLACQHAPGKFKKKNGIFFPNFKINFGISQKFYFSKTMFRPGLVKYKFENF